MCKLGMQQTAKIAVQTGPTDKGRCRYSDGDNTNIPNYLKSSTNKTQMSDYFHFSDNKEAGKRVSKTITNRIHNKFNNLFFTIGCFEGTFSLQLKEGIHPYQAPSRRVAYTLQKPLKEWLEWIQKQQIIVPLGLDKI